MRSAIVDTHDLDECEHPRFNEYNFYGTLTHASPLLVREVGSESFDPGLSGSEQSESGDRSLREAELGQEMSQTTFSGTRSESFWGCTASSSVDALRFKFCKY